MIYPPADRFQMRGSVRTIAPAIEPATVDEVRKQARIDHTHDDWLIANAISEAREMIEDRLNIAMISQTWRATFDYWPGGGGDPWWDGVRDGSISEMHGGAVQRGFELPRWPLASITSVTTYDEESNATAVTVADVFDVDTDSRPGRLALKAGQSWPVALRRINAIEVVYSAGYGTKQAEVPAPLRRAVRNIAAFLTEHRGDCGGTEAIMRDSGAGPLLDAYRIARL